MRSPCWAHMAHKVGSVDFCSLISAVVVGKNNFLPASKVHHCSKPGRYVDNHGILRLLGRMFMPWKAMWPPWVAASWSIQQNQPHIHANMIFQQLILWKHVPPPCQTFGPFEPRSLQQRWLRKNYIFGAAASYHGLKALLSKEFAEHENEAVKL